MMVLSTFCFSFPRKKNIKKVFQVVCIISFPLSWFEYPKSWWWHLTQLHDNKEMHNILQNTGYKVQWREISLEDLMRNWYLTSQGLKVKWNFNKVNNKSIFLYFIIIRFYILQIWIYIHKQYIKKVRNK